MSAYGIGAANNGGGTDGLEYTFPNQAVSSGDNILLLASQEAFDCYMNASSIFDVIIEDSFMTSSISGDDAIELFFNNTVVETFGEIDCDPNAGGTTCPEWEYTDTWAYKDSSGTWTYGDINSTDNTETIWDVTDTANIYPAAVGQETASGIDVGVIGNFVGWVNDIDMTSTNNKFYHLNQYYLRAGDEFKVRQDNAYNIQWDNGSGGNVTVTTSGFYDIVLNTCADAIELNSSTSKDQNISIITSADSYGSDIAMSTSDGITYTLDHTFVSGEDFKFRRDGSWDANWGDNHSADGNADFNSANNISAPGVGAYNIEFNLENLNYVFTEIDEADTTAPVITLVGDAVVDLSVGDTYSESGATASDNVDGDISADIVIGGDSVDTSTVGQYTVTYNVSDDAGNAATEVTRTVNVTDTTAPVITLVGDAVVDLSVGDTYSESGATASDNVDGDISADVVIGGDTVDTSTVGQYTVTYNVSDDAGNAATEVTRVVNVTAAPVLSTLDNRITNSSFSNSISVRTGFNQGQTDEWFTVSDPNIEQTPEGTIHFKSNNSANAILRYKLNPTKFTAGKSYKILFDVIALGIDTDLTKGLTFQLRKASGTGSNNSNVYFWYDADSQTGTCSINNGLYSASANKGQAHPSWGTPRPWSTRGGANFTIPAGTDLSADPMILTFVYNKESSAPADATSGWYIDNVSITEIPADSDGVIVEDGSLDIHNRRKSSPMPYTTNYWIQSTGNAQVFADRDTDNNITQTALLVAAYGSSSGNGIARKLINNLTANTDYVLSFKIKATEGKTYNKGANVRMKTNDANGTNLDGNSTLITVAELNAAAADAAVDFIEKEHEFNSGNNTELVINFYHANESGAALEDTYIYLDDFVVEEAPEETAALELKGVLDFSVSWPGTYAKAIHLVATDDITDLSAYGIGAANNGGGTDGLEYTFPNQAVSSGDNILLLASQEAFDCYMNASSIFDVIIEDSFMTSSINGDDAIELFFNNTVVETFGEIDCDPNAGGTTCPEWEYTDTWAYKDSSGTWTYGDINSTDNTETIWDVTDTANIYPAAVGQETASGIDVGVIGNFVGWVNDIDMTSTNNKFYHLNQYYLRAGDEFKVRQDNAYNIQWDNGSGGNVTVTTSGFYDIVLNTCADAIELNTSTSKDQNISIITSADSYGSDIAMSTSDGITYTLDHTFVSGEDFKFRRDGSWDANWGDNHSADGNADFNSANNISAPGVGAYNIEFSLENLNYVFTSLDETAPVITLVGDAEITVEVGSTYTDLGATASDNYDGDITTDVVIGGHSVDTSVIRAIYSDL